MRFRQIHAAWKRESIPLTWTIETRIAIDGPVGAGKTTVGRQLADRLDYRFLDTGLMYRALTRAALDDGMDLDDEPAMTVLAGAGRIEYRFSPDGGLSVDIDGEDATVLLRTADVDRGVSITAALPAVRAILVARQREIAGEASIVMVGRDIGTVVLPDAELKIYLTASAEERARRRHEESMKLGIGGTYDEILSSTLRRDRIDSDRAASPLMPAEDSVLLVSDNKRVRQVVDEIVELAESRR